MRHAISIGTAVAALLALAGTTLAGPNSTCRADLDGDGRLTIFDFLAFQNEFSAGCPG
jgi:hypothetical protein